MNNKKHHLKRMNFLYQASNLMLDLDDQNLSRFYLFTMKKISKRVVLRM